MTGMRRTSVAWASLVVVVAILMPQPAGAGSAFTVTRTDDPTPDGCDPGDCSLREAIDAANVATDADTIDLPAGHYVLSRSGSPDDLNATGDLDIHHDTTIQGAGPAETTIDAAGIDRPLDAGGGDADNSLTVTLSGITVTGGQTTMGQDAGGIITRVGLLELIDVVVTGNTAANAGGIHNTGTGSTLTLLRTTVAGNVATSSVAGGVENGFNNTTTITDSAVVGNVAEWNGGGIYTDGILNLTNVTVYGI